MASRIDWKRLRTSTLVIEAVQLVLALVALALGWLSFPMLAALLIVEVLLITVMSSPFYRTRAAWKLVGDLFKILFACAFCSVFLATAYIGAGGFKAGMQVAPAEFAVLAGMVSARLSMIAALAWHSSDRRLTWTRESLQRGGVVFVTLFLSAFACLLPGIPLAAVLSTLWPGVAADVGIGGTLLLVQAGISCVMSTMSDRELAEISQQPYLD